MTTIAKTVLITGASSGIGSATAVRLGADGHHVVLGARREDRLYELVEQIRADGGSAQAVVLDVTDRDQVRTVVDAVVAERGGLEVFVNNAGVMPLSRLDALLVEEWDRTLDVNVRGLLHGIAAALPHFEQQKRGHFVTTSAATRAMSWGSTQGIRPGPVRSTTAVPARTSSARASALDLRARPMDLAEEPPGRDQASRWR